MLRLEVSLCFVRLITTENTEGTELLTRSKRDYDRTLITGSTRFTLIYFTTENTEGTELLTKSKREKERKREKK